MKKKLVFLIPTLSPGGAQFQTINQVNYLFEQGHEPHLVLLTARAELLAEVRIPSHQVHILGESRLDPLRGKSVLSYPKAVRYLKRLFRNLQPDHVLAILPVSHAIMRLLNGVSGNSYSTWQYHRSMQYEVNPANTLAKKIYHWANVQLSKWTDTGHLFISKAVQENIKAHMPIQNGHLLYNALPNPNVDDVAAKAYIQNFQLTFDYLIVIPGRLHPVKGHSFFINGAAPILEQRHLNIKVLVVGGGDQESNIKKDVQALNQTEIYHFTGNVPNALMLSFLALANLVVIPSLHEGFGNAAVEALMQRATMLVSNTGGLPEIAEKGATGFLFKRGNEQDLQEKLHHIIESKAKLDPDRLFESYKNRFTLEGQVKKLLSILYNH